MLDARFSHLYNIFAKAFTRCSWVWLR